MKKSGRVSSILVLIIIISVLVLTLLLYQFVFNGSMLSSKEATVSISNQMETYIKSNYNGTTLTAPQMRSALNYFKDTKDIAVYLNDDIRMTNSSISEISWDYFSKNDDESNKLYLISNVYIYGTRETKADGNAINLRSVSVSNGFYRKDVSDKTGVGRLLANLEGKNKYRAVLIMNESTSDIIGVYFQKYQ